MKKNMEIRSAKDLRVIDLIEINSMRKFYKTCRKVTKIVLDYSIDKEITMKLTNNYFIVRNKDKNGFIIGLKEPTTKWL